MTRGKSRRTFVAAGGLTLLGTSGAVLANAEPAEAAAAEVIPTGSLATGSLSNELQDPGFELDGAGGSSRNWSPDGNGSPNGGRFVKPDGPHAAGKYSLQLSGMSGRAIPGTWATATPIQTTGGQRWFVEAWIKRTSGSGRDGDLVIQGSFSGKRIEFVRRAIDDSLTEWTPVRAYFTAPRDCSSFAFGVWADASSESTQVLVDDLIVRRADGPGIPASDFGAIGDGRADDSAALQAALDYAGTVAGSVQLAAGHYRITRTVTMPEGTTLEGVGGASTRFPTIRDAAGFARFGGVMIQPDPELHTVALHIAGRATTVRNIVVGGLSRTAAWSKQDDFPRCIGILVMDGFETRMDTVRVVGLANCGLMIAQANNISLRDVFVDNCGTLPAKDTPSTPAVYLSSRGVNTEDKDTVANVLDFVGLTIERSRGTALAIGSPATETMYAAAKDVPGFQVGGSATTVQPATAYHTEFIRILNLHVEMQGDGSTPPNAEPLVLLGQVRAVNFVAPFIAGLGGGPMIRFVGAANAPTSGGVALMGGTLFGHNKTDSLVELSGTGSGFSANGVRFSGYNTSAISIVDQGFFDVHVDPACVFVPTKSGSPVTVADSRIVWKGASGTKVTTPSTFGSVASGVQGHVTIATASSALAEGSQIATFSFGTWQYGVQGGGRPILTITPTSRDAAKAGLYTVLTNSGAKPTGFTVMAANAVAGSADIQFDYVVS